jgi:hypothetical protein
MAENKLHIKIDRNLDSKRPPGKLHQHKTHTLPSISVREQSSSATIMKVTWRVGKHKTAYGDFSTLLNVVELYCVSLRLDKHSQLTTRRMLKKRLMRSRKSERAPMTYSSGDRRLRMA